LEISTDFIYSQETQQILDHSYSEGFSGVSIGNDSDCAFCLGIDYS